jgi:hypothetical protein
MTSIFILLTIQHRKGNPISSCQAVFLMLMHRGNGKGLCRIVSEKVKRRSREAPLEDLDTDGTIVLKQSVQVGLFQPAWDRIQLGKFYKDSNKHSCSKERRKFHDRPRVHKYFNKVHVQ